jgi:DNA-binding PadR family transcriptional regulator
MTTGLNLSTCYKITNEGLQYLTNMRSDLDLSRCHITDEGLQYLTNMRSDLDLEDCQISDEGLQYLSTRGLQQKY